MSDILSSPSRALLASVSLCVFLIIVWSLAASIDEITRAPGQVIPSTKTQLVQTQDGGVLEELLVQEGDLVTIDQILARIDKTRAEAAFLETRAQVAALSAQSSRLNAELLGRAPTFEDLLDMYPEFVVRQQSLWKIRQSSHNEEIAALERIQTLARKELNLHKPLLTTGEVSRLDVIKLERQIADIDAKILERRNEYLRSVQEELTTVGEKLEASRQLLAQRKNLLDQTELRAPANGIVKNIRITTLGGVLKPGEDVMRIVPTDDDLLVEARVSPSDIAFVDLGMPAKIKVDSYDYTIYGELNGSVIFVSADTLDEELKQGEEPYYRVRVKANGKRFTKQRDKDLEIQPGMTAMVEVLTGKKTVFQYMTKPLVKTLNSSMGER